MSTARKAKAGVATWFTHNLAIKLLSLGLSIVLFSIVHSDQDAQRTIVLDVVAMLPPPEADKMLLSELPHQVKVTLLGSRARINSYQRDDFQPIQMDLTDTSRRFHYFDFSAVDVGGNVQVSKIQPATVVLDWADSAERRVPIKPRFEGAPAPGFEIQDPVRLRPEKVTIRGPAATVNSITAVYADVVSVEGLSAGEHVRRVPLEPLPAHTSYREEVSAHVTLVVIAKQVERTFRRLLVSTLGEGDAVVRPATVSVTLRGPAKRIDQLDGEQVVPAVQLAADAGVGGKEGRVVLRGAIQGLEVVEISPPNVLLLRRRR